MTKSDVTTVADQARSTLSDGADALRDGADELASQLPAAFEAIQTERQGDDRFDAPDA